eukprot:Skav232630  [mRNA]  locus=scaffold12:172875:181436:+ [translate_table: standard]
MVPLFPLVIKGAQPAEPSWCQAGIGNCVGQRHMFRENKSIWIDCHGCRSHSVLHGDNFDGTIRFADWDGDGDTDVLIGDGGSIWFHERLSNDTFSKHELVKLDAERQWLSRFEVADWDGDNHLDLLLCTLVGDALTVSLLNRSFLLPMQNISEFPDVILVTNGSSCDLLARDFDEDDDMDLILGVDRWEPTYSRYFERISDYVMERTGDENPLSIFNGTLQLIADVDGDGRLEFVLGRKGTTVANEGVLTTYPYLFQRAADGSLVEAQENPLIHFPCPLSVNPSGGWTMREELHVADWNSDGLPDVLKFDLTKMGSSGPSWFLSMYAQHVLDQDMELDLHAYEDIEVGFQGQEISVDWNKDGLEDLVVLRESRQSEAKFKQLHLYENSGEKFTEVFGVFENVTDSLLGEGLALAAIVDWDRDGDLDLIILSESDRKVHYHEMVSGKLHKEEAQHPFKNITISPKIFERNDFSLFGFFHPIPVDWDNDGDMDLFLGPPDGRYFEQMADGTLYEWPREQSPVGSLHRDRHRTKWAFLDCDADGDYDLLRMYVAPMLAEDKVIEACEHNSTHILRCDPNFPCLGTNVSKFRLSMTDGWRIQLGNVADGRLRFITYDYRRHKAALWSPGFCFPADPCHSKGLCLPRQAHCTCIAGHELSDCSGCEPNFFSLRGQVGQVHDCKACPGDNGKVCYGRGRCFDDVAGKALAQHSSTAHLIATGNGSCSCNEAHFYGSDDEGRSTCMDGICPAGTEENDGRCRPCAAGTFSEEGGSCRICLPGTFSPPRAIECLTCAPGTVSTGTGASACDACPAGTYEVDHQLCNECPAGFVSSSGSTSCSECHAGSQAPKPGSILCESCAAGTFSSAGSSKCQKCVAGKFSSVGSSNCSKCLPGTVSSPGSWACDVCPAGAYEVDHQLCNECPAGFVSSSGSTSCSECHAGSQAPKPGSILCESCAAGTFSSAGSSKCQKCVTGKFSSVGSSNCSDCLPGTVSSPGSWACDVCPGGTFAAAGSGVCNACPVGQVSSPNSAACHSCESIFIRSTADDTRQNCQVFAMDVVLGLIFWITWSCLCFLSLVGFSGRIPISDVSAQGKKVVVTTSMAHFLRKRACPKVTFKGTGVPDLESSKKSWTIKALSLYQLTLHGDESTMPLDTSTGYLYVKFPHIFFSTGVWHCPLIWWCLLFLSASAGAASKLTWPLILLLCGLGLCAGSLAFAMRRRQSETTPLVKRRRQFLKEWPLVLERCARGPDRSITAGKLHDFLQKFFETFIKERSMYYVCSNIVKPLTEPFQLSFVEMVGPTGMQWFVSHYWGMPVRHFTDAIRKHAQCSDGDWEDSAYWICTLSNSQWHVKEELGNGQWQNSSFYLAIRSPECKGTTMIIDESVLPLRRIWCLFEVYQTISLSKSRSQHFHGLLLCTSTGVLQHGNAGTDVAVAVAETVAELDTRSAEATAEEDRQMIHSLIEQMPGGFDTMNTFVRDTICSALEASHLHYESTFKTLKQKMTSTASSSQSTQSPSSAALPTLLTSVAQQPETKVDTN